MSDRRQELQSLRERGKSWEAIYEELFDANLPYNFDMQEMHGEGTDKDRILDYGIDDDDGRRQFILELKSSEVEDKSWNGDVDQLKDMIDLAITETDQQTLFLAIPERFHEDPKIQDLKQYATNNGGELIVLPIEEPEQNVALIKERLEELATITGKELAVDNVEEGGKHVSDHPSFDDLATQEDQQTALDWQDLAVDEVNVPDHGGNNRTVGDEAIELNVAELAVDDDASQKGVDEPGEGVDTVTSDSTVDELTVDEAADEVVTDNQTDEDVSASPDELAVDTGIEADVQIGAELGITSIDIGTGPTYPGAIDGGH